MKSKIVSLIGAAMLFGMTSLGASAAGVKVKWSTSLAPGSHPESVYYDSAQKVLYVSNIVGPGDAIDGNGYIARMNLYGQVLPGALVTGLNGPKGMVMSGSTLWVSDINRLVEVDTRTGAKRFYDAPGSVFLNDTAVDADGNVYVSDIATRKIWRLKDGQMSEWVNTPLNPNGLLVVGGKLVVAGWGVIQPDGSVSPLGNLFTVDLKTKMIANLGNGQPIGTLDGLESDGAGNYLVTDFEAGKLYRIRPDGTFTELADFDGKKNDQKSADLEVLDKGKTAIIPFLLGDKVVAYTIN